MEPDIDIVLSAFKYVALGDEKICRLCFTSTHQYSKYIQDLVEFKKPYLDRTVSYAEMFEELDVVEEPLLPQTLCDHCAKALINGYLFKKLYEYANEQWKGAFKKLNKKLSQAEVVSPSANTAFIMMSKDNVVACRKTLTRDKTTAAAKLNRIIKSRSRYVHRKATICGLMCETCGIKFKSRNLLLKHMKTHKMKPLNCPQCFKTFSTPLQLTEHAERIHYPKKIKCGKCNKMFSTPRTLKAHDRQEHVAVICKLCFIQFPSRTALKVHLDKHDVLKCPRCGKNFINRQTYRGHIRQCGDLKVLSFFCDICNKGYIRKNALRSHLKIDHGFGKVLSCSWCSKKFDAASRLRNHIVKHTRERNFHCSQCKGKFVTQAALVYHIRLHTGERPFHCDLCDESFLSASRRMEHKRRKHLGPTLECHICHIKFVLGNQLRKHVARHSDPHSKLYVPVIDEKRGASYIVRNRNVEVYEQ